MFNRDKASCVRTSSGFQKVVLLASAAALPGVRMLLRKPLSLSMDWCFCLRHEPEAQLLWSRQGHALPGHGQPHSADTACSGDTGSEEPLEGGEG